VEKKALNKIFVDTLFVIALVNSRDAYHVQAQQFSLRFSQASLVTTDAVLLEVGNALSRNFKAQGAQIIESFL
jgi:uncharacterized protein